MALWLVRAGKYGEHELKFLEDKRVYLTFSDITEDDLGGLKDYEAVRKFMAEKYPSESTRKIGNWSGQVWAFSVGMKPGDWVVMPSKLAPTIAVGEVTGSYAFDARADQIYRHSRAVNWINTAVPRSSFDQDLLYSMGAFLTVCEIKRNDAEKRIRAMAKGSWNSAPVSQKVSVPSNTPKDQQPETVEVDLEELARDAIAKLITQRFKGHGMARLVEAILKAQGFATYRSPEGPDKGIDILAAGGAFGFESPRICVQVKSGDSPADRPEFTQLIGAMQSVGADQGLFVSWGGFKPTVLKEVPNQFFKVRVWNENDLIEQLLANYDKLDQDVRADLPLKKIWMVASSDE
jgi:restriction system protein